MSDTTTSEWKQDRGWGWIWGKEDEVGALNAMTSNTNQVTTGVVYDLGAPLDRDSYVSPGHVRTEVLAFRTPEGLKRGRDLAPIGDDPAGVAFHTAIVMISDHAGAQIIDNHWYNGFKVESAASDFGPRRADASKIPPIIARGVLADVAGFLGVDRLERSHPITAEELELTLESQGVTVDVGEVVLVRTGAMRHWNAGDDDRSSLVDADSAGLTLGAARWLVEQKGAILVAGDTSTLEVVPAVDGRGFAPVHEYLLVEQGVHVGELHNLEALASDRVYRFTYVALCPPLRGTTAGFALRPIAIV
jgi:kynurenine formamidase